MVSETNIAKKAAKVDEVVKRLEESQMIFAASAEGLNMKDVTTLKSMLPEGTTVATVKNTLMRRAIAESQWEMAGDLTKQSNMWFFVGEDIKESCGAYDKFAKELKREKYKGGVYEGTKYDSAGIAAIAALPSKQELITKIAVSLKMVPTKLGRSVNAVPSKLARAIKMAVADEAEEDEPSAE